jgi:short-subunit dehydrogenase
MSDSSTHPGVVLVTGATGPVGTAITREFARAGFDVALEARDEVGLATLAAQTSAEFGVQATVHARDLARPESARALRATADIRGLRVTALVNAARVDAGLSLTASSPDELAAALRLGVIAPTELCRIFALDMVRDRRGFIVNIVDDGASGAVAAAAAAHLRALTDGLGTELAGTGVRVAAVPADPLRAASQVALLLEAPARS